MVDNIDNYFENYIGILFQFLNFINGYYKMLKVLNNKIFKLSV